jgi:DNA primase
MDTDDIKEEIRRRVDIAELIGHYVPLQRAGSRLRARCPFHQERTPSFYVDPDRGFWKCFGCGAAGDLFSFVMKMEGLTFPEAAERLAQRAGLEWRPGPEAAKSGRDRQTVLEANDAAAQFFEQGLHSPAGVEALDYLQRRGVTAESMATFRLGYAPPGWDNLLRHLAGKGHGEQLLEQAGLAKRGERGGHYDVFRHRIIFPIVDVSGRVIGFGGRALDPEDPAKYLNSPDTPVFKKGVTVYGLNLARKAITDSKRALVVEGYMDVIALVEGGFRNVVACLGTSTTEAHLRLLARYAEEIVFVYDADAAGVRAALRNAQLFDATSADAKIAVLPEGQDPDDCIRTGGPAAFQQCLDNAASFVEYQIRMAFQQHDPNDADGRLRAAREAVDILLKVRDPQRREEMLERTADWWARGDAGRAAAMARTLRLELRRRQSQMGPGRQAARPDSPRDRGFIMEGVARDAGLEDPNAVVVEQEVIGGALSDPALLAQAAGQLSAADFGVPHHRLIAERLLPRASEEGFMAADIIAELPEADGLQQLAVELRLTAKGYSEEEFAFLVAKLVEYRGARGVQVTRVVAPEADTLAGEVDEGEDFRSLEKKIQAAINEGRLANDADYERYQRLTRRFHGKGQHGFVDNQGETPLSPEPSRTQPPGNEKSPEKQPPAAGS